jgi:hypothetical protein
MKAFVRPLAILVLALPTAADALPVTFLSKARVGLVCFDNATTIKALDCWLDHHPDVAGALYYEDSGFKGTWASWPPTVKSQLHTDFDQMVAWYHGGMPPGGPNPFPMPVPAGGAPQMPAPGAGSAFWMTEAIGKRVYLSQAANNLAAELTAAFPWSITTYTPSQLKLLLSMNDSMHFVSNIAKPGYFFQYNNPSPATAAYTVGFFKQHNLIGQDAADTVARLFAWERVLIHFFVVAGDPTPNIYPYFWGPNAPPVPDSEVIKGTVYSGPIAFGFGHFTGGCSGTQDFMKSVLRAVNIPVERRWVSCEHATPIFPTIGLAMTHGDDPYDGLGAVSALPGFGSPAPSEFFISINAHDQLFPANQPWDVCTRTVGIQVANIAIEYASDALMNLYCEDLVNGASHASGKVYDYMKWYYPSVQTLENMGLWANLDAKVNATNFCGF